MTGYNGTYTTSDLSDITVDVIATGGVEIIAWVGIFVLFAVLGLVIANFLRIGKVLGVK